jgi:hypothetical protein
MVNKLKVSEQKYVHWSTEIHKCPSCGHEVEEKDMTEEISEKVSIYQKFDYDYARVKCKVCKKITPLSEWKFKEEHFEPYAEGEEVFPEEEIVDAPLYRCPDTGLQVRPIFAEMCKDCACKKEKDCSFDEGEK